MVVNSEYVIEKMLFRRTTGCVLLTRKELIFENLSPSGASGILDELRQKAKKNRSRVEYCRSWKGIH